MPGFPPPTYFNHDRLVQAAAAMSDIYFQSQLLDRVGVKPSRDALLQMREMLNEPALRFVVFDQFAKWAGREDLRPRWVWRQNDRGFSEQWGNRADLEPKWEGPTERRIVNEEELIRYWRENPPW